MFNLSVERSLNFNRHTKEDIHPFAHFFTHKCSSPWCGAGGSQSRRERKASLAVAIIKAGMWKAPLESYGVLWELMGGIRHINFLVRRSQWA